MNPNAYRWRSLEYDTLGGDVLRTHISIDHSGYAVRPVHVPVDREGVVP